MNERAAIGAGITAIISLLAPCGCAAQLTGVGQQPSAALTADGLYISWREHPIGDFIPDLMVGVAAADIDGDGDLDIISGGYSRGPRGEEGVLQITDPMGRIGWFQNPGVVGATWTRHDISRRKRGMFDMFVARDLDNDGDMDFVSTRGNSYPYDGVFWLEQVRSKTARQVFTRARREDSEEMPLP